MADSPAEYFRRDQERGVTAPDLSKDCGFSEHVVRARGKRTRFTSVSLDKTKIDDFGPALYLALRPAMTTDGHSLIEHSDLVAALRTSAASSDKAERVKAVQAIRYAQRRKEGLIDWRFNLDGIQKRDYVLFGYNQIQKYFLRV